MSSQELPHTSDPGVEIQPADLVEEFDPQEDDDFGEWEEHYEPAPEPPLSDAMHDRTILLMAAICTAVVLVLCVGITLLSNTGIFGADCGTIPTNRTARCYQSGFPSSYSDHYAPTSVWFEPFVTPDP
jgi:hypothetical protein